MRGGLGQTVPFPAFSPRWLVLAAALCWLQVVGQQAWLPSQSASAKFLSHFLSPLQPIRNQYRVLVFRGVHQTDGACLKSYRGEKDVLISFLWHHLLLSGCSYFTCWLLKPLQMFDSCDAHPKCFNWHSMLVLVGMPLIFMHYFCTGSGRTRSPSGCFCSQIICSSVCVIVYDWVLSFMYSVRYFLYQRNLYFWPILFYII